MLPNNLKNAIPNRDWGTLRREWRAAFVDYEDVGAPPSSSVRDIIQLNNSALTSTSGIVPIKFVAANLRETALREAIFVTHKAGALLRSFNRDIQNRETTYPEITAYTASYFLSKSILLLLGFWMGSKKISGRYWIFDMANQGNSKALAYKITMPGSVGHVHSWDLYKKSLYGLTSSPIDGELLAFCGGINADTFAKPRNELQYNNCEWKYDDLHADDDADVSWLTEFSRKIYTDVDPEEEESHFCVQIFLMLFRANFSLITDVAEGIETLEQEVRKIASNIPQCEDVMKLNTWIR